MTRKLDLLQRVRHLGRHGLAAATAGLVGVASAAAPGGPGGAGGPGGGVDIGAAGASVVSPIGPLTATAGSASATGAPVGSISLADPTGRGADAALACGTAPLDWAGARRLLESRGPALALSRDRIRAAQADLRTAGERPNPTLSFGTAHYAPRQGIGPGQLGDKYLDSVLRIDQIIERGNKRGLRQAQAERNVEAAELQAVDDRRTQELALFDAYADLKLADVTLSIAREQSGLQEESLTTANKRFKAGDLPESDVVRQRVETGRAATEVSRDEAAVAAARVSITALLGCPETAVEVSSRGLDLPTGLPDLAVKPNVDTRPDVRAADARTRAAAANVDLVRANLHRDVDVGVQVENDPGPAGSGRSIGFGIAVPLFVAHRYEGEIARAEADRLTAEDTARATRVAAVGEVATARTRLASAVERARRARGQLLPDAEQAAKTAEFAYRRGALGLADLLDARRTLRAVRLEASVADDEALRAYAGWNIARGLTPLRGDPLPTTSEIDAVLGPGPAAAPGAGATPPAASATAPSATPSGPAAGASP